MFARLLGLGALIVVSIAYLLSAKGAAPERPPYIQGRNRTVLFLGNREDGLVNVLVATASALLESNPDLEVHFASFPALRAKIEKVSSASPASRSIIFHELKGRDFGSASEQHGKNLSNIPHPPAAAGIAHLTKDMQMWLCPWSADDYLALFHAAGSVIDDVDPAVVVLDTFFRPGIDATRQRNRQHAFVTPNTLVDNFLGVQPYGSMFWKYPAVSSGFSFPVPLRKIPENIYLNIRFIYSVVHMPALSTIQTTLKANGIRDPLNFYGIHRDDVPWITQETEGASIPVDYVPPNVTSAGPISLSTGPAAEQDPKLAAWLENAPTVLINLGSGVKYSKEQTSVMALAIAEVLAKTEVQVIWKFRKFGKFDDHVLSPIQPYVANGRLYLSSWLTVDPLSLLETGHIALSVHHGGSSCYHETISAGVPHVILPLWADLYNFAALAEGIDVGVWGCKETNPEWTAECLSSAMLEMVVDSEATITKRQKARALGERVRARGKGRDIAAREVAKLAYVR